MDSNVTVAVPMFLPFTSIISITLLESSMIIVPSYKTKCTDGYIDQYD